ncbi:hypothetical protein [Martelella mangrovi]|uniref:Uncharacterized protein n=1 Tax=Martelella mangrovi TaxID=1397477 RepID=A0ABV2IDZ6_9HYPH
MYEQYLNTTTLSLAAFFALVGLYHVGRFYVFPGGKAAAAQLKPAKLRQHGRTAGRTCGRFSRKVAGTIGSLIDSIPSALDVRAGWRRRLYMTILVPPLMLAAVFMALTALVLGGVVGLVKALAALSFELLFEAGEIGHALKRAWTEKSPS